MKIDKRTIKTIALTLIAVLIAWGLYSGRSWVRATNANIRNIADYVIGCQQVGVLPTGQQIQAALAQAAAKQAAQKQVPAPEPAPATKGVVPKK